MASDGGRELVLDASVALAMVAPNEDERTAAAVIDAIRHRGALVPAIWPLEIANVLVRKVFNTLAQAAAGERALMALLRLPVRILAADTIEAAAIARLARKTGLSAYDAAYLHLAQTEKCALATFDRQLARAAAEIGVELWTIG
ncbi:type II toxin-antitoxin system VapC family toxin [Methyloraptor flagellatus]|uniref:Ribonuclease VapC n=1 Tax=Methyloraptor flagellatus TaxID=3162530 RepID=A0AAU7XED6_9HYPH